MSEEFVTSSRRPIAALEDYRERNAKRAKEYYYTNHEKLKNKLKERAQIKRDETKESVKTFLDVVGEISLAIARIQAALKAI